MNFNKQVKPITEEETDRLFRTGELVASINRIQGEYEFRVFQSHYGKEMTIYSGAELTLQEAKEALQMYFTA